MGLPEVGASRNAGHIFRGPVDKRAVPDIIGNVPTPGSGVSPNPRDGTAQPAARAADACQQLAPLTGSAQVDPAGSTTIASRPSHAAIAQLLGELVRRSPRGVCLGVRASTSSRPALRSALRSTRPTIRSPSRNGST